MSAVFLCFPSLSPPASCSHAHISPRRLPRLPFLPSLTFSPSRKLCLIFGALLTPQLHWPKSEPGPLVLRGRSGLDVTTPEEQG